MATSIYSSFLFEIHHHQNLITQVKERKSLRICMLPKQRLTKVVLWIIANKNAQLSYLIKLGEFW